MKSTEKKKQIRKNRTWKHFLSWLGNAPYYFELKEIKDYQPEKWRDAFERFQTFGPKSLTVEEFIHIQPLISGQKAKEICINGHVEEAMDWWSSLQNWSIPFKDSLLRGGYDRLTRLSLLRIMKSIQEDGIGFFSKTTSIDGNIKSRFFDTYVINSELLQKKRKELMESGRKDEFEKITNFLRNKDGKPP
jgi:hypothetical protein